MDDALPRLPTTADFAENVKCDIVPPAAGPPLNVLILLHGLGDTKDGFTQLAKNLALPQTCGVSLQAPTPIPALITGSDAPSFHWCSDITFSSASATIDADHDFAPALALLSSVVGTLTTTCKYPLRNIFFFGFGQGGMAALFLVSSPAFRAQELGGLISVGGKLPESVDAQGGKIRTPVLVCGGSRRSEVTRQVVETLKGCVVDVEYVKWEREGDGMMRSREEVLPLMRFWARRLRSRAGVPEGAVEV